MDVLPRLRGRLLDVGCGDQPYRRFVTTPPSSVVEYVGLDIEGGRYSTPDVTWDGISMPFADSIFDCALMTEVLEHCPAPSALLAEVHRVLGPGSVVFITVPFVWPLHDVPHDEWRYTPYALRRLLRESGFRGVSVSALGGWDASLAQMLGLWAKRRPMPKWKRSVVLRLLFPVIRGLLSRDVLPTGFLDGDMVSGCAAVAEKGDCE